MAESAPLPRLLAIVDGFASGHGSSPALLVRQRAVTAVTAGVGWVQLRDHAASPGAFARAAEDLVSAIRRAHPETLISVNTRVDVARRLGVGVHLGLRGPSLNEVRRDGPGVLLSASVHDVDEADAAVRGGADALLFSPVFPTASKPGHSGAGLDALAAVCEDVSTPVFALGGVTPERVAACREAGAYGVAALSGLLFPDTAHSDAVQAYRAALGLPPPSL